MHQLSGTAVVIFNKLDSLHRRAAKLKSDSSLKTDTKLRDLGLLPLKERFMFNKAVLVLKHTKILRLRILNNFLSVPTLAPHLDSQLCHFQGHPCGIPSQIKSNHAIHSPASKHSFINGSEADCCK